MNNKHTELEAQWPTTKHHPTYWILSPFIGVVREISLASAFSNTHKLPSCTECALVQTETVMPENIMLNNLNMMNIKQIKCNHKTTSNRRNEATCPAIRQIQRRVK